MEYGIDVSAWNRVPDWNAVRANNISFASVKLTQADYYVNPAAVGQVAAARAAGVTVGGYHFGDGNKSVSANVNHFVQHGRRCGVFDQGSLAPMLDLENSAGDRIYWNASSANRFVGDFIRGLRKATDVAPVMVYASLSVWQTMLRPDDWADDQVFLWIALYNGDPGNVRGYSHRRAALHQHTDQGNVPGVQGHVDRNVTLGSFTTRDLTIGNIAPPAPGGGPQPQPIPEGWTTVTVGPGQTLSQIASERNTTWQELARVNNITNPDLIYSGQIIRVPPGAAVPTPTPVPAPAPAGLTHHVRPGETLSGIATKYGTTVAAIASANGITNPNLIFAGQVLAIPGRGARSSYTVRSGDTLSGIATRLGVSVEHLVRTNGISNPDRIFPGQVLTY